MGNKRCYENQSLCANKKVTLFLFAHYRFSLEITNFYMFFLFAKKKGFRTLSFLNLPTLYPSKERGFGWIIFLNFRLVVR
ncbi:MAG: hypothetical protein A2007_05800 [Verrucomicrobia bacterium GWC2_42_7]|nr:MAG: hypothetical protein A2007_05800 [Verrucomicrobia bacterium GWC2_42_7]